MADGYDVLIVEDSPSISALLGAWLEKEKISYFIVDTLKQATSEMHRVVPTVAVIDLGLPDGNGMDLIQEIASAELPIYPIVVTGQGSLNVAVEAMHVRRRNI